jgi:hypothetical protein
MKIKAILASLLSAVALSGATAGEWCPPAKDTGKCPVECCSDLGLTFSTGYDSAYYFRGLWFSNNNTWSSLTYNKAINDKWSFALGTYYTSSQNTDLAGFGDLEYSELDAFTSVTYDAGFATFALGFTHFQFFDTFSGSINGNTFGIPGMRDSQIRDSSEVSLTMTIPLGDNASIYALYANDVRIGGQYAEMGGSYTFAVSDCFSIIPSVQVGYNVDNYFTYFPAANANGVAFPQSGWNHIRPMITAPYKINECMTLVPYVAANLSLEARELINGPFPGPGENDFYGGVSFNVTF